MRALTLFTLSVLVLAFGASSIAQAQTWEFGGGGGGGSISKSQTISGSAGTASAGLATGWALTGLLGHNNHRYFGGEIRYTFGHNDLKLSSGATTVKFGAQSHALHYDMLLHTKPLEAKSRPYLAVGGGMKYYRGTGAEQVYQPLGNIALLTQTHDMRPLLSVGGGVKWRVGQNVYLRLDVRDYITPFPKKVITPVGNVKADGWIHNITPMIGFTFTF